MGVPSRPAHSSGGLMGSAARWKPSADHPPLLQLAANFDQHLVRDDIERTEPTETPTVRCVTEARIRTSSDYHGFMFKWGRGDRRMLVASGRGVGLSVGPVADRDRPLGSWSWWARKHLLGPILHQPTHTSPGPGPEQGDGPVAPPRSSGWVGTGRTRRRRDARAGSAGASHGPVRGTADPRGPVTTEERRCHERRPSRLAHRHVRPRPGGS
jgi:hypothetical protein